MHDAIMLKRQSIEEVNHIEDGLAFAKCSLVFAMSTPSTWTQMRS